MSKILLNPGPTNTNFLTKLFQWIGSDQCHREEEFQNTLRYIRNKILKKSGFYQTHEIAIICGSGTMGMQSMICSLVPDNVLVINSGAYAKRAMEIMRTYKIEHQSVECKSIDDLKENKKIKAVYFVENETSTGEYFCIDKMKKIYPKARFYIDATASFGASSYEEHISKIAGISFCSNKCLQSTPGLSFVIWNKKQMKYKRCYYGDLSKYEFSKMPFTLPTQTVSALKHVVSTGMNNKHIFDNRRDKLVKDMKNIGMKCYNINPCNSIVAFIHPSRNYSSLHAFLKKRGMVIYSGIDGVENSFRISTMSVKFDRKYKKILRAFNDSCLH